MGGDTPLTVDSHRPRHSIHPMKLKQTPGDFLVEELTGVRAGDRGGFALYRLDKTGWTTPDALQIIGRKWNIPWQRMNYGGMKDRHATTVQYLTIFGGPLRDLEVERIQLTCLGRVAEPYSSRDILANRFTIAVRSLSVEDESKIAAAASEVERAGYPNYFDDQRFGSVTPDGQFVARKMIRGQFEDALKQALAGEYEFDKADAKKEKQTLLAHWGDWPACKAALPRGHARSLVCYLADHPTDFKGAVARLRPELQGLYLSAFQSDIWNRALAKWLKAHFPADALGSIQLHRGPLPVPSSTTAEWESLVLPLPSARLKPPPDAAWLPHLEAVLAEEELTLAEMKIRGMDKPYFSKGERIACVKPTGWSCRGDADELNRGRRKLTLRFELPRGSYATMLVKRITCLELP